VLPRPGSLPTATPIAASEDTLPVAGWRLKGEAIPRKQDGPSGAASIRKALCIAPHSQSAEVSGFVIAWAAMAPSPLSSRGETAQVGGCYHDRCWCQRQSGPRSLRI